MYQEEHNSTATHNGKQYNLNILFARTHAKQTVMIPISDLVWVLAYTHLNGNRIKNADIHAPLLVYNDPKYGLTAIDGAHRLSKAYVLGVDQLPAKMVTDQDLKAAEISNE